MDTVDIPNIFLLLSLAPLIIPVVLSKLYSLGLIKDLLYATIKMSVQLALIAIFLRYLFTINNTWLNILWLAFMVLIAAFSAVRHSDIKVRNILFPTYIAFFTPTVLILLFINLFIIRIDHVFDARYLIILGGMMLRNSLRGNIIGISSFYRNIQKDSKHFTYRLSLGSSFNEAITPYLKESVQLSIKPTFSSMTTMGIVALPGLMTGIILGGTSPEVAIKYQIVIMIGIVVSTISSVLLTILLTLKVGFTKNGLLNQDIFIKTN